MCDRVPPRSSVMSAPPPISSIPPALLKMFRVFEFESSRGAARLSRSNVGIARVESCAGKVSQLAEIDGYVFGDREREPIPPSPTLVCAEVKL